MNCSKIILSTLAIALMPGTMFGMLGRTSSTYAPFARRSAALVGRYGQNATAGTASSAARVPALTQLPISPSQVSSTAAAGQPRTWSVADTTTGPLRTPAQYLVELPQSPSSTDSVVSDIINRVSTNRKSRSEPFEKPLMISKKRVDQIVENLNSLTTEQADRLGLDRDDLGKNQEFIRLILLLNEATEAADKAIQEANEPEKKSWMSRIGLSRFFSKTAADVFAEKIEQLNRQIKVVETLLQEVTAQ